MQVRDLEIQNEAADLVIGTYGRGVWIADISILRQAASVHSELPGHLFEITPRPLDFTERDGWGAHELYGDAVASVPNEPDAIEIAVWLTPQAKKAVIEVWTPAPRDRDGVEREAQRLGTHTLPIREGLHRVTFPFSNPTEPGREAPEIGPGELEVKLTIDGTEFTRRTRLLETPRHPLR